MLFSLGQVLGLLCARTGAVQSCGIYSKSTIHSLEGVFQTLRNILSPRIASQSCGVYTYNIINCPQGVRWTLRYTIWKREVFIREEGGLLSLGILSLGSCGRGISENSNLQIDVRSYLPVSSGDWLISFRIDSAGLQSNPRDNFPQRPQDAMQEMNDAFRVDSAGLRSKPRT